MSDSFKDDLKLPPEQQEIRDKCFHPSGTCVEFPKEEIEQSIPDRFEKIVSQYPNQSAINVGTQVVTYSELNAMANCVAHAIIAERGVARLASRLISASTFGARGRHDTISV